MLITGLAGVDKDAMLTAYETGESGTSDAMMTAATPMMATDVAGSDDDGDEGATNVRVDMEQVKRVTESTGTYIWDRIRAIEREARGLAGGVNILVMLRKPYEVALYDLPLSGFCGAIIPSQAHREGVAKARARPPPEGWGVAIDLMRARIAADARAAEQYPRATWPAIQLRFGLNGIATNVDFYTIPTLSGDRQTVRPASDVNAKRGWPIYSPAAVSELRCAVAEAGGDEPARPSRPPLPGVDDGILRSWDLRREMAAAQRQIPLVLRFVFMYFRLKVKYMQAHRQLKRAIRVNKRQRTLQLLEQAEAAAKSKDSRALFGVVRLLCPGGRAQRIRLRGDKGQLLNGEQECRELAHYASKLFHALV